MQTETKFNVDDKIRNLACSAKFFVHADGSTVVQKKGILSDKEINKIQQFIKENYKDMYKTWRALSDNGFYQK